MTGPGLGYDRYRTNGFDEWLTRVGDAAAPPILFVPPLFEDMNRTRALIVATMRRLAERGFGCWLPDLPGTGESERALEECGWDDWRGAVRDAGERIGEATAIVSLRGGCLLDDAAKGGAFWRFAPVEGASLARDLARSGLVTAGGSAGYPLGDSLSAGLRASTLRPVAPLRTARLATDLGAADAKLEGPALWRRSEPGSSAQLSAAMAADIADWIERCGGC